MNLNREEILTGFIFGISFVHIIGWWCLPLAMISSFLWALSGSPGQDKFWRRLGVPFCACLIVFFLKHNWIIWLSLPMAFTVLSIGYGIPTIDKDGNLTDEGSWLGRFFWNKTGSSRTSNILTRAVIYLLLFLSFIPAFF
ncbi:hypothetical protein HY345_04275 [Candidatus Microgenomates bacterium]|nr:hypothetical protein [Candidatus Microgenomates bacterium]